MAITARDLHITKVNGLTPRFSPKEGSTPVSASINKSAFLRSSETANPSPLPSIMASVLITGMAGRNLMPWLRPDSPNSAESVGGGTGTALRTSAFASR